MEPFFKTAFLLLLVSLVNSVPVLDVSRETTTITQNECARSCSPNPAFVSFPFGNTFRYRLKTETEILSFASKQRVSVESGVELTSHSGCELAMRLVDARVGGVGGEYAQQMARELEARQVVFGMDDGRVTGICSSADDNAWALDVKKAVISALQMSANSVTQASVVMETDIQGECETNYFPISQKYEKIILQKEKRFEKCSDRQTVLSALSPRQYYSDVTHIPITSGANSTCEMTFESQLPVAVTCRERQHVLSKHVTLVSGLSLRLESQRKGVFEERSRDLRIHSSRLRMTSRFDSDNKWRHSASEADLQQISRDICQQLTLESHEKFVQSVESFPELISILKYAEKSVVQKVAKSVREGQLCASKQLWSLWLDAAALAGSEGSIEVLVKSFENKESQNLFSLLSFASEPKPEAIEKLLPLLASAPKHVTLGISGLVHNARHNKDISESAKKALAAHALQQLVQRLKREKRESEVVALVRAVENVGVYGEESRDAVEYLLEMALNENLGDHVRISALKAIKEGLNENQRKELLEKIFAKKSAKNEIRIQTYRTVVLSGASRDQLEQIRQIVQNEDNKHVQQYVRSHQRNLLKTSDPHKKDVLPSSAPKFAEPQHQLWGVSANYESSFMVDALGLGLAVEADVIYAKESEFPRALAANLTIPAFGRELQLIEVNIRQKGFGQLFGQKLRQLRGIAGNSVSKEALKEIFEFFASAQQWTNEVKSRDLELAIGVKIDGKHVISVDLWDLQKSGSAFQQLIRRLRDRLAIDSAFAVQPLNTRIRMPNGNGMPIELRLNATIVSALKANVQSEAEKFEIQINPNFVLQLEAGVSFAAKTHQKGVEIVTRVSSGPQFNARAEVKDSRVLSVKIAPKERQTVIRIEGALYERDSEGQRKAMKTHYNYDRKYCSPTRKPFGMEICAKIESQTYEVYIEKTDRSMKSFDFEIERPAKESRDAKTYRVAFRTPNSEIDREMSAELEVLRPSEGRHEAKVQLKSPWMRWSATSSLRNEEKEQSVSLELQNEAKKVFAFEAGLESQTRGQKREFRPRIRIQLSPKSEPISMQGSVSVAKGRKNQLQINLEGNQKQFLKGSFVREGEKKSNELRLSSDLSLQMPGIEVRVNGLVDKGVKHVTSDLTVEYRVKSQRKESVKVSAKLQNLTQSTLTKMSAFGELTSTQFPKLNFHLAYNLLRKPSEHMENELTVAWRQNLNSKVHVLHVTKLSEVSGEERKLENTLDVEITPLNINYELRANADLKRAKDAKSGPKYFVEVVGKDRTGRKQNDVRATFDYTHVSRAPLHLTMDATLKTASRDMQYKDVLREEKNGEYKGQTSLQWQKGQKADLEYDYRIKSNDRQFHHEFDAKVRENGREYRHGGLLRLSRNDLELKSKFNANGNAIFDIDSRLSRDSDSRVNFETPYLVSKVALSPYSAPQTALLDIHYPKHAINHVTNVEFVPKLSFALKSETKGANGNIFSLDSHVSRTTPSRVVITSAPFDGRLDLDLISDKRNAILDVKSARNDWKHNSVLNFEPKTRIEFKSKTEMKGKPILSFDSELNRNKKSFLSLDFPLKKSSIVMNTDVVNGGRRNGDLEVIFGDLKHKSEFDFSPKALRIQSKSDLNREPIQAFDYRYNRDIGLHSMESKFGNEYQFDFEGKHSSNEPFIRLSGKAPKFDTNSKLMWNSNQMTIESKNKRNGNSVFDLNAILNRDLNNESTVRLVSPLFTSQMSATPAKSAKFEYNCHHLDHVTAGQWGGSELGLDSKTLLKRTNDHVIVIAKHAPLRETLFQVKTTPFEVNAHYSPTTPKVRLQLDGSPDFYYPYSHVTELEANPRQRQYSVVSRTDRLTAGQQKQPLMALNARYNHLDASIPSSMDLKFGPEVNAKLKIQPFGGRQRMLQFESKHPKYSHVTDIQMDDKALNIKSRTEDNSGRNVAKIDSYLTPISDQKSHFSFVSPNSLANFEFEPKRRANFELNVVPFEHKTEITSKKTSNGLKVISKTTKDRKNILDINSELNLDSNSESHFEINSPIIESKLSANPSQKSAKIQLKTRDFEHKSQFKVNSDEKEVNFESKTDFENQLLANIIARIDAKRHSHAVEVEIPRFAMKSGFDLGRKSADIDFRSKLRNGRHILASIAANDKNGFHADFSWDKEKDPNQRLVLDVESRREGDSWAKKVFVSAVSAAYAGNELRLESRMAENALIAGPHDWTLSYRPKYNPQRDSMKLQMKHVITGQEMQCNALYSEGQALKFAAKLNAKSAENAASGQRETVVSMETTAPKNPDLEVKISFSERHSSLRRRNAEIFAELKAIRTSIGQQFVASGHVRRDPTNERKVLAAFVVETPSIGEQTLNIAVNVDEKEMTANAMSRNGKQLEARAKIGQNSADFELKSNADRIPSIRATITVAPEEMAAILDLDSLRKFDFLAKKSGKSVSEGLEGILRLESSFAPKMESKLKLKVNSRDIEIESSVKYDSKPLIAIQITGKQSSGVWSGRALIERHAAEFASAALKSSLTADSLNYEFAAKGQHFAGMHATFTSQQIARNERKVFIKVCAQNDVNCVDIKSDVIFAKNAYSLIPVEKAWLSITKMGTNLELKASLMEQLQDKRDGDSLLALTTGQSVRSRVRNQFLVSINSHQIGFDHVITARSAHSVDSALKLYFPSNRWMNLKTDFARNEKQMRAKTQFVTSETAQPLFESDLELHSNQNGMKADFRMSSNRFQRSPKSVSFETKAEANVRNVKIVLDLSRDPNHALTIETKVERKPVLEQNRGWIAAEAMNTTVAVALSTRDRSLLDFAATGHVSRQSAGLLWRNVNKRGIERKAFYFFKLLNENRFEGVFRDSERALRFAGQFGKSAEEVSTDLKVIDEKTGEERDVRMSLNKKCVKMETRVEEMVEKRYHFCLNSDSNENNLNFDLQSKDGKSLGIDLQIQNLGQKALKMDINWSPKLIQDVIRTLRKSRDARSYSSSEFSIISDEFIDELSHKMAVISRQASDDVFEPVVTLLSDEMQDVLQEMWKNFGPKMSYTLDKWQQLIADSYEQLARLYRQIMKAYDHVIPDWAHNVYQRSIRSARRQCKRSETCYKALYALENYGVDALMDLFYATAIETAHTTHRVVMTTSGKLWRALPNAPQWLREYGWQYKQWIRDSFDSLIASNDDLRQFVAHVQRLLAELTKDNFQEIEWPKVGASLRQMADVALSSQTSSRVLVWDPARGRVSVELRTPLQSRRLRSVMTDVKNKVLKSENPLQKKWKQIKQFVKSMF